MPPPSEPLEKLGFLTIGSFDGADPGPGHETTLQVIDASPFPRQCPAKIACVDKLER